MAFLMTIRSSTLSRLLLVNDNEAMLYRTARMLEGLGWEVHAATSRKEAMLICIAHHPTLAIIDIEMRGGAGLETIAAVRRSDKNMFVVAVTRGHHDDTLCRVADACGANHYLVGPVSETKVAEAVEIARAEGFLRDEPH